MSKMQRDNRNVLRRIPGWAWLTWLGLIIGGFITLETVALLNEIPGDTLSENVWVLLAAGGWPRVVITTGFFGFTGVIVWLGHHFFGRDA